jgi:hypothetical protein
MEIEYKRQKIVSHLEQNPALPGSTVLNKRVNGEKNQKKQRNIDSFPTGPALSSDCVANKGRWTAGHASGNPPADD